MNKEELKKSTCINLRCVTQSSKGGVLLNQLQNDYKQLLGTPIPFKDLGYSSLENFLRDIPDVICLQKNADGSLIAEGVADASTAHIAKLISKQKPSKKSKCGSAKPAVVTRTWGNSGKTNSKQKIKTPLKDSNSFQPKTLDRKHEQNSKVKPSRYGQQDLKKSVLVNLRSVVQSSKDGVPLNRLQKDYRKFIGSYIPFEDLGYRTLHEFIQSIPDVINLKMGVDEQFIAVGVVDEATAHLFGNSVKSKPSKTVPSPNESSKLVINNRATVQIPSEQKAESSFFKLPPNTMELSDLNTILKNVPAKKKVRKKTQPIYSVSELISKNKMKHASKEELLKAEPFKAAEPVISSKESSASEVSFLKTDSASLQNPNNLAETIQDQIKAASLSPLVWLDFILFGPSTIKTLRKKLLSFYGFTFSTDSKEWERKKSLISEIPKKALYHCLFILGIEYDPKDSKQILQDKLIDFFAAYTEFGANEQETEKENQKDLYASSLTLSSVSSDVLSKRSYYANTETSDTMQSDKNIVAPKTKHKIVSNSDSDFIEPPVERPNLLRKSSTLSEEAKKPAQLMQPNDKGNFHARSCKDIQSDKSCKTKHSTVEESALQNPSATEKITTEVQNCKGIQSSKNCKTKHPTSTESSLQKPTATEKIISVVQKPQSLDKNSNELKIDMEESSKTENSSIVSSKSTKRNRRRKRKKSENTPKSVGLSVKKPDKNRMPWWQVQQMIKLKKEKREKKSLLSAEADAKIAT